MIVVDCATVGHVYRRHIDSTAGRRNDSGLRVIIFTVRETGTGVLNADPGKNRNTVPSSFTAVNTFIAVA